MTDQLDYLDFEININKADEHSYIVQASAAGGRVEARFSDPFSQDKRTIIRQTLTTAALRSSARVRSSSAAEVSVMKELGSALFEQTFRDRIKEFYYQCLGLANQQAKGLRLRLSIDPSLADLPWEFLATSQKEFLALDTRTPIVRYVELPTSPAPLKAELPLRVLVVIASPKDQIPLDTQAEKKRINSALNPLEEKRLVKVSYIEGPETWPRLIDALRPNETHILHFIGHGAFDDDQKEGILLMEDESGGTKSVDSDLIRVLLQGKSRLRLGILNSCLGAQASESEPLSSVAVGMVRAGIPAVIAMQFEVSDHAAEIIAGTFYKALALNFPVDAALTESRREIALLDRDSLEWATPVLYMQVPNGQLFDISRPPEAPPEMSAGSRQADLGYKPSVPSYQAPAAPPLSGAQPAKAALDLSAKAAERYKAGEEAEIRGDWEAAITGYKGASLLVPGYQDAAQRLAYAERRNQCVKLYKLAQDLFEDKKYNQVLETLKQIRGIDPRWVDSADLQTQAECGVTYQQALSTLRAKNRDEGAELLREVIIKCADFEDVILRLDNLAAGGDGLYGETAAIAAAPVDQVNPHQPQPPQTQDARIYQVSNLDIQQLAEEIKDYFQANNFENQIIQQGSMTLVQGKKGGLRSLVGMGQAATVMLEATESGIKASVGGGKWLEQGAAIAVSMFVLWPLLITGGLGMAQQKGLMDTLWKMVESRVTEHGGSRVN